GILRRPLVVAYSDAGSRFGWILGPRFEIGPKGQVQFNHTSIQRSVQVSLIVPGWARRITIPYKASWVGESSTVSTTSGEFQVDVPGDDSTITTRLLALTGERRVPFIDPPCKPSKSGRDSTPAGHQTSGSSHSRIQSLAESACVSRRAAGRRCKSAPR